MSGSHQRERVHILYICTRGDPFEWKGQIYQENDEQDPTSSRISHEVRIVVLNVAPAFKSASHLDAGSHLARFAPSGIRWRRVRCASDSIEAEPPDTGETPASRWHIHSLGYRSISALWTVSDVRWRCSRIGVCPRPILDHPRTTREWQ